jgi:hypothetical protein
MPVVLAIIVVGFFYREVHDVRCIVFVERIVAAVVLASMANQLSCLSKFIRSVLARYNVSCWTIMTCSWQFVHLPSSQFDETIPTSNAVANDRSLI